MSRIFLFANEIHQKNFKKKLELQFYFANLISSKLLFTIKAENTHVLVDISSLSTSVKYSKGTEIFKERIDVVSFLIVEILLDKILNSYGLARAWLVRILKKLNLVGFHKLKNQMNFNLYLIKMGN